MTPMKFMAPQATPIGHSGLSYEVRNGRYQYWYYTMPNGFHDEDDIGARNVTTQVIPVLSSKEYGAVRP